MKNKLFSIFFFLFFLITLFFIVSCTPEGPSLPGAAPPEGYFTVNATAGEHGSITPSGEITVPIGESVTFKISPDQYYKIDEVLVNGVSDGAIDTLVLTVTGGSANFTVHATFKGKQEVRIEGSPYIYETINSAYSVAKYGDIIVVYPGVYNEYLVLNGKDITLRGCDSSDFSIVADTIIDGGGSHPVISFTGNDKSTVEGLTLKNGGYSDHGGGIYIYRCSPTIKNNIIKENSSLIAGGGIYMEFSTASIIDNTITKNVCHFGRGGGIAVNVESVPIISGNSISENSANHGGGIYIEENSSPTIISNNIMDNESYLGNGGGICVNNSTPTIGGIHAFDIANFNHIYSNIPDQIFPDNYPYNYTNK